MHFTKTGPSCFKAIQVIRKLKKSDLPALKRIDQQRWKLEEKKKRVRMGGKENIQLDKITLLTKLQRHKQNRHGTKKSQGAFFATS